MNNYEFDEDEFRGKWKFPHQIVPEKEIEKSWIKFRERLEGRNKRGKKKNLINILLAAAMLALLVGSYFFVGVCNSTITVDNFSQVDKKVTLPDGSLVLLKKGSEIQYNKRFLKNRSVKLEGEAFFKVVKASCKKFKVATKNTTTTVLGTSFSVVENNNNEDVEILLYTGKLIVSDNFNSASWTLAPGERFKYSQGNGLIKNFKPKLSFKDGNKFIDVNDLQLEELFFFLEKRFGYKFLRNSFTKNKIVTLRINKQDSLQQIIRILTIINKATYEIDEDKKEIQISSK